MKRIHTAALAIIFVVALMPFMLAQDLVRAPREDGAQTPLRVYAPNAAGCAPLALIRRALAATKTATNILPRVCGTMDGEPS